MAYQKVYMNQIFSSSLIGQLAYMWRKDLLCDAVIKTGNTSTKAHRLVMIAACPMLQHMENASLGSHLEVRLSSEVSKDSVQMFLQYLYEGYMKLTENNYKEIEKIAKLLQVDSILKCCLDFAKCLNQQVDSQYGSINEFGVQDQQEFKYVRATDLEKTFSAAELKSTGLSNKRVRLDSDDRHSFSRDYETCYDRGQSRSFSTHQYGSPSHHGRQSSQSEQDPVNYGVEVINLDPAGKDSEGWPIDSGQPPIQHSMGVAISTETGARSDQRVISITDHDVQVTSTPHTKPSPQRSSFQSNPRYTTTSNVQQEPSTWQTQARITSPGLQRKTPPSMTFSPAPDIVNIDKSYAAGSATQMREKEARQYTGSTLTDQALSTSDKGKQNVEQRTPENKSDSFKTAPASEFQDSDISIIKVEHIDLPPDGGGTQTNQQETIYIQQVTTSDDEGTAREDYSDQSNTSTFAEGQVGTSHQVGTSQSVTSQGSHPHVSVPGVEQIAGNNSNFDDPSKYPRLLSASQPRGRSTRASELDLRLQGGAAIRCYMCFQMFPSKEDLLKHLTTVHGRHFQDYCCICEKGFKSKSGYYIHVNMNHSAKCNFPRCKICGKQFASQSRLRVHMNVHTKENSMKCPNCMLSFSKSRQLWSHIREMHSSAPPPP